MQSQLVSSVNFLAGLDLNLQRHTFAESSLKCTGIFYFQKKLAVLSTTIKLSEIVHCFSAI